MRAVFPRPTPATVRARLQRLLSSRRFAHSVAAARLAAQLAPQAGVRPERAYLAGLLHDCARELSSSDLRRLLRSYQGRYWDSATRRTPGLWHAPAAAVLARRRFGVRDPGLLRALARHSTGGSRMSSLEKLLFVADYSEPHRPHADARVIRRLAQTDLEAAVVAVLRAKIDYLRQQGLALHPRSLALAREVGLRRRTKRAPVKGGKFR